MSENRDLINSMTSPNETVHPWAFTTLQEEKWKCTILLLKALNLCKWKEQEGYERIILGNVKDRAL